MFGPSMDYPGGMTEVIRAYSAAGLFEAWPLRYISTYAGRDFSAKLRPWLFAVCGVLIRLARRRVHCVPELQEGMNLWEIVRGPGSSISAAWEFGWADMTNDSSRPQTTGRERRRLRRDK